MWDVLREAFSSAGFMPHGHCFLWKQPLLGVHVISDSLIGLAYVAISVTLFALIRKIRIPFSAVVLSFGLFIGACGATHFLEVWTLWNPDYWWSGAVKVVTALASVSTGVWLVRLRRPILTVAEAARLSEQRRLDLEVLTVDLETRVRERTRELERMNAELAESEMRFRVTFEQAPVGIAHVSLDGGWLRVNAKYCEILGYTPDELLRMNFRDVTHPDDLEADMRETNSLLSGETSGYSMEKRYIRKDGGEVWVNLSVTLLRRPDGSPRYFVGSVLDISDRKRSEARLREAHERISDFNRALLQSEAKFRRLVDSNIIGIAYFAEHGRLVEANEAVLRLLGCTREDLEKGRLLWRELTPDEWLEVDRRKAEELKTTGIASPYEKEFFRKDGSRVRVQLGGALFERQSAGTAHGVVYMLDVTERTRAEWTLRQSLQARDEFISVASHELKTPITALKLQCQTLDRLVRRAGSGLVDAASVGKFVDTSTRQADRLTRLVEDMLDVARINTGKLTMVMDNLDASQQLGEVMERYRETLGRQGILVRTRIEPGVVARWDRIRIEQVLVNLVNNAVKYGKGNPVEVSLTRPDENTAELRVRDFGIGIAPENADRIFERFERAVPGTHISGLGLGLYIVRQIVQAHHGRIFMESEPEKGTLFTVTLPLDPLKESSVA